MPSTNTKVSGIKNKPLNFICARRVRLTVRNSAQASDSFCLAALQQLVVVVLREYWIPFAFRSSSCCQLPSSPEPLSKEPATGRSHS